jgi:preprotein translocase subunit SecG
LSTTLRHAIMRPVWRSIRMDIQVYFNIAQIIISIALTVAVLLQLRNSGLGSMFGGMDTSVYRTRRGVERILFNVTIGLSIAFFVITILNVMVS